MKKDINEKKQWKKDFPFQRTGATEVSRRDFAKFLCLISGGLVFGNGVIAAKAYMHEPEEIEKQFVCEIDDIPVGGTRSFVLEGSAIPYILIRIEDGEFRAYEQKCTHLACAVYYKPNTGKIECPCHNGWFNAYTGEVLQGPPPRALPQLEVIVEGNKIFVQSFLESPKIL